LFGSPATAYGAVLVGKAALFLIAARLAANLFQRPSAVPPREPRGLRMPQGVGVGESG